MREFFAQKKQPTSAFFGWYDRKFGVVGFGGANEENIIRNLRLFYQDIFNGVLTQPRYLQLIQGNLWFDNIVLKATEKKFLEVDIICKSMTAAKNYSTIDPATRLVCTESEFNELFNKYDLKRQGYGIILDGLKAYLGSGNTLYLEKIAPFLNNNTAIRKAIMSS